MLYTHFTSIKRRSVRKKETQNTMYINSPGILGHLFISQGRLDGMTLFLPSLFRLKPQRVGACRGVEARGDFGCGCWQSHCPPSRPWRPGCLVQKLSSWLIMRPGRAGSSGMPRTSCSLAVPVFLPALGGGRELHST